MIGFLRRCDVWGKPRCPGEAGGGRNVDRRVRQSELELELDDSLELDELDELDDDESLLDDELDELSPLELPELPDELDEPRLSFL